MGDVHVEHIGRAQFIESLIVLKNTLEACSFVAIDTELGGLSLPHHDPQLLDTIEQRYAQHRESVHAYPIVQFGISCFTWNAIDNLFDVRTFEFPIFPGFPSSFHTEDHHNNHDVLPNRSFQLQSKCLEYIRAHGFDLNEWIDHGIPYLAHGEQQEKEVKELLARPLHMDCENKFRNDPSTNIRMQEHQPFLQQMMAILKQKWPKDFMRTTIPPLDNEDLNSRAIHTLTKIVDQQRHISVNHRTKMHHHPTSSGTHESGDDGWPILVTEPLAPFKRYALVHTCQQQFPHILVLECDVDNDQTSSKPWLRCLRLIYVEDPNHQTALRQAHASLTKKNEKTRNLAVTGFTAVMDIILNSKVPIIGHNMLLDVMHCFHKFYIAPKTLPATCGGFLHHFSTWLDTRTHESDHISCVFDTKALVEYAREHIDTFSDHLEHSALEHVYKKLHLHPFYGPQLRHTNRPHEHRSNVLNAHQAGYDAFMTGAVFIRVCVGLGLQNETLHILRQPSTTSPVSSSTAQSVLESFRNVIYMSHVLPAGTTLRLPGPGVDALVPTQSRERFIRVELTRTATKTLTSFHIKQCIAWALGIRSLQQLTVHYESKRCVLVQLPSAANVDELLSIRSETKSVWGTEKDPMPSIGCVDLMKCPQVDNMLDADNTCKKRRMQ